jgi:diketogulonate reductase-like aldo/keto reductase
MIDSFDFRTKRRPLNHGAGHMPVLGFGTLIPDAAATIRVISAIAARVGKTPAHVLLAWAVQRGTALLTTPRSGARARENFSISALPEDAFYEINRIQTRQKFNEVVKTGSPGFIPQGR